MSKDLEINNNRQNIDDFYNLQSICDPFDILIYIVENGLEKDLEKDLEKAVYWLNKAAENGNEFAQPIMSCFYQLGIGVEKDEIKAFEYHKKSAEIIKEPIEAVQIALDYLNQNGEYTQKDLKKADNWYYKIAEKDLEKGWFWFYKTAEKVVDYENGVVQYFLGECYRSGIGIEKDETKAFEYYKKYAENRNNLAQNVLGYLYENGKGTEKDLEKAIYWYNKAAENGYEIAQFNLGRCYQIGTGVEKDETKAFEYYKKSAEKEFVNAQFQLGECYRLGIGIEKDETKAFECYKILAEEEYNMAQCILGHLYENGQGIENKLAQSTLNNFYKLRINVKKEETKSINAQLQLYNYHNKEIEINDEKIKADNNIKESELSELYKDIKVRLGYCYQKGIGIEIDKIKAFSLYKEAAENDSFDAKIKLGYCYQKGIGIEIDKIKAFNL